MIEAIILDFDGVILNSMGIKSDAFYNIYSKYGNEIAQKAVEFHEKTGGMPRYDKFEYLHKTLLNRIITKKEIRKLDKQFSAYVMDKISIAPYIKGVEKFLGENYNNYKLFVSSGTPTYELIKILEDRKLTKYFTKIYGSPTNKIGHITEILTENNIFPQNAVFIGDSSKDKEAANKTNIHFIAKLGTDSTLNDEKYQINDFTEIYEVLKKIYLSDKIC